MSENETETGDATEYKLIDPYVGPSHYQDPDFDGKADSAPLCGRNVEIQAVFSGGRRCECPDCQEIAGE